MKIKASTIGGLIANETARMSPLPTQHLLNELFVVQDGFVNIFLIKDNGKYVAIDAGINADRIRQEMASLKIDPDDVKAVLLTHSDIDHVAGIGAFPKAEVFLPEAEVAMLDRFRLTMPEAALNHAATAYAEIGAQAAQSLFGDLEYWPEDDIEATGAPPNRTVSFLKNMLCRPYRTIHNNEILTFDSIKVESIPLPGHTRGLTGYLVNGVWMFPSDGLSLQNGRVFPFNAFLNQDEKQHRASIDTLRRSYKFDCIFTSHYGYTDDAVKAFEHWGD